MTTTQSTPQKAQRDWSDPFNRVLYFSFVALSIYFLVFSKDLGSSMSNLGLALIFDPFKQEVSWNKRPSYQRAWLIFHVSVVFVMLGKVLVG
ncbi:MAG: hypothetical protein KF846_17400 [Cyclobacteriaceae bacterium]|nr:hypothetical protein [Cyclobacteriaceae bacterium]